GELVRLLREELQQRGVYKNLIRGALRQLNEETKESDPVRAVSERRRAESVSRAWNELNEALDAVVAVARFSKDELGQPLRGLSRLRRLLDAELAARSVRIPGPDHGVMVYRLNQTAALPLRTVFVLGLTNDGFPGRQSFSLLPSKLRKTEARPVDESTALLGRVIRRAERVWLSAPMHGERGETQPAATLSDLLDWWSEREQPTVAPGGDSLLQPTNQAELLRALPTDSTLPAPLRNSCQQAVKCLRFDESIPLQSELLEPILRATPQRSITEFETFIDCPRKYLFRHLLHVLPPLTVEDEVEADVIGSLAHRALEIFFSGQEKRQLAPWSGGELNEDNFDSARQRMLHAAGLALLDQGLILRNQTDYLEQARGGIVGALVPLNAQREELVAGLEKDEERSPGILLRALLLQRDLIKSLPTYTEFEFSDETALRIGELRLRGRIDRIDYTAGEELEIYDYKTGNVKKPNDFLHDRLASLQLPLYLLAAQQVFGERPDRRRAAEVSLKNYIPPTDLRYAHPKDGPLVEHAAIRRKSSWEFDYRFTDDNLDYAEESVLVVWDEIKQGRLAYRPRNKGQAEVCKRCDYRNACGLEPLGRLLSRIEESREEAEPGA
ncbi:PD-(D/E)XK nuclease family protein, partial [bacterium]|nr:PD-(D/E)XK nuclease family protein [bacterium]